jgi:hypothetical protein
MSVTSLDEFKAGYERREERQSEAAQVKFTPSEMAELDRLVNWLKAKGANGSRSGVIRALVLDGLAAFQEEIGEA